MITAGAPVAEMVIPTAATVIVAEVRPPEDIPTKVPGVISSVAER